MAQKVLTRWYVAGPLFTLAERLFNVELANGLREAGLDIWLPQEREPRLMTAKNIFDKDVEGLDWSEGTIAIYDGADPDSGTSWEAGYTYALNKPIIAVRTDFRSAQDGGLAPYNLMLTESASKQFNANCLQFTTVDSLVYHIMLFVKCLREGV